MKETKRLTQMEFDRILGFAISLAKRRGPKLANIFFDELVKNMNISPEEASYIRGHIGLSTNESN